MTEATTEAQTLTARRLRAGIILLVILAVIACPLLGLGWFHVLGPCGTIPAGRSVDELSRIMNRWQDTLAIADSTARIALSGPVSDLQDLRYEAEGLRVPRCLETTQTVLLASMDHALTGFLNFMAGSEYEGIAYIELQNATDMFAGAEQELDRIRECMPYCPSSTVTFTEQ